MNYKLWIHSNMRIVLQFLSVPKVDGLTFFFKLCIQSFLLVSVRTLKHSYLLVHSIPTLCHNIQ